MATKNDFLATTGHFPKAWNAKRSDLLISDLRNSRYNVNNQISEWLADGYIFYDIPAEGGLTYLSAKTPGKYLCVWTTCAPAYLDTPITGTAVAGTNNTTHITLDAGASAVDDFYVGMTIQFTGGTGSGQYNIVTDYDGYSKVATVTAAWGTAPVAGSTTYKIGGSDNVTTADITIHTDVILTTLIMSVSQLSGYGTACYYPTTGNYASKLNVFYANLIYFNASGDLTGINLNYSTFIDPNPFGFFIDGAFTDISIWNITTSYIFKIKSTSLDFTIENVYLKSFASSPSGFMIYSGAGRTITVKNCLFKNTAIQTAGAEQALQFYGTGTVLLDNVATIYYFTQVIPGCLILGQIIYADSYRDSIDYPGNAGINFRPLHIDRQIILNTDISIYTLDTAGIMTDSNFDSLDALISTSLENIRGTGFQYSRRYYQLSFQDSNPVDSDFKTMFAREQSVLVIWRDDLDATFVTDTGGARKIKNLSIYENGGTTSYDYRNNENFFLLTEDDDGNEAVFCWYEGMVYPSAFTDFWDDTVYTIKRCFQILEPPDKLTWRNKINGMLDSPIECSAQFQEMVSIFVDKR